MHYKDNLLKIHLNHSLVSNVGIWLNGIHITCIAKSMVADQDLGEPIYPSFALRFAAADQHSPDHHFGGAEMQIKQRMRNKPKILPRGTLDS